MQVLLDDIREKAGQAGYDPQITNQGIEEAKLFLKRVNAPGLYGKVMRPVSDGQLAEMRKGIPERLRAETVRGNSERRPASDPPPNPVGRAAKRLMFECVPASERIEQPGAAESKLIERLRSAYENKHSLLEKLRHDTRKQSLMSSTSQPTSGKAKK